VTPILPPFIGNGGAFMNRFTCLGAMVGLACCLSAVASAAAAQVGLSVDIGTPGAGAEANYKLNEHLALRAAIDGVAYARDEVLDEISYHGRLKAGTVGLFADWHPTTGPFFISAGVYAGSRKVTLAATPTTNVEIGDTTYTPAQIGILQGEAEMAKAQPFLGLGWDQGFSHAWGIRAVLGAAFSGAPDVTLSCLGGTLCATPAFQTELVKERAQISEDTRLLKVYPIIQVGLTKRF
jgi:hypothetical protein